MKKGKKIGLVILAILVIITAVLLGIFFVYNSRNITPIEQPDLSEVGESEIEERINLAMASNKLSDFDLSFLKLENEKKNKIYSPLSIKYTLKMLEEATTGESKSQIAKLTGNYKFNNVYVNSENMAFANALFVRDTYKDSIKTSYIDTLKGSYKADVIFDSFKTADNVNNWVSKNTLNLINNLLDEIEEGKTFMLVNALGIDMDWEDNFLNKNGKFKECNYPHEGSEYGTFGWIGSETVVKRGFINMTEKISAMNVMASFNNYDIVKELGEENIIATVEKAYKKYEQENPNWDRMDIEKDFQTYIKWYMEGLKSNYGKEDYSTDFSLFVDDNVKIFAKDLKEYNNTKLEYIGIMPRKDDLASFIEKNDAKSINEIIGNLKTLKRENFRDGVVTEITGFIPKFKFEYDLDLIEDLNKLGVTNIFEQGKANLTEISNNSEEHINSAIHKANIDFTEDGIKAAAVTMGGGLGAGDPFDYIFTIPVEEIDITFDRAYMFLIRDKDTKEVWFVGTVYEPLKWEDEPYVKALEDYYKM